MLKAHMINKFGDNSIYYTDNPNRTLSLENCLKKVFTNDKDPLRKNLEKIIELRNTSSHFITEEYEMVYIPLFQSCVLNFSEKLMDFHQYDITDDIPQNFLILNISMAIEGKRLKFTGSAWGLFGNWIKWWFFTVITFGIYGFWVFIKLLDWKVKNTTFRD